MEFVELRAILDGNWNRRGDRNLRGHPIPELFILLRRFGASIVFSGYLLTSHVRPSRQSTPMLFFSSSGDQIDYEIGS